MTRPLLALAVAAALTATVVARQNPGLLPAQILKPSPESWPTFHGDYSGRHYSTLDQINKSQREEPVARVDEPAEHVAAGSHHRRQGPGARARSGAERQHQGDAADGQRHALPGDPEQCLRARREDRPSAVALLLEEPRRLDDRQPRPRHVGELSVPRHARSAPGLARGGDRQGTLEPAEGRLPRRSLRHDRANGDRQSRLHARRRRLHRRARVAGVEGSRRRARCSGSGTRRRAPAKPGSKAGRTRSPRNAAAPRPGSRPPTIPSSI